MLDRNSWLAIGLVVIACAMSGASADDSSPDPVRRGEPTRIGPREYRTAEGKSIEIPREDGSCPTVLVFVSSTCPIANRYAPELNRLWERFDDRVRMYLVHTEPELSPEQAKEHRQRFNYRFDAILDPDRHLVRAVGAKVTPEAAVLDAGGRLVYRGRIDDRFPDIGIRLAKPSKRDLLDAVQATLEERPIKNPRTKAVGCFIE